MEIPSSHAGVVKELKVKVGDKVAEGSVVCCWKKAALPRSRHRRRRQHQRPLRHQPRSRHRPPNRHLRAAPAPKPPAAAAPPSARSLPTAALEPRRGRPESRMLRHRSASSRANWASIWRRVAGSGPKGRILHSDVQDLREGCDGRCGSGAQGLPAAPPMAPVSACCRGRRWISRNSARPNCCRCRASRNSAARTCIATGS